VTQGRGEKEGEEENKLEEEKRKWSAVWPTGCSFKIFNFQ
jgi:hypothetical protein